MISGTHGVYIANTIDYITDDTIDLSFYRVMDYEGKTRESSLIQAIGQAVEDDIDFLNLSLGKDHINSEKKSCDEYNADCFVSDICRTAIDAGVTIIAGVGNRPKVEGVACPSLCDRVISVGAAVLECGYPEDRPPGACWIESEEYDTKHSIDICSNLGCGPGCLCSDHQNLTAWDFNPAPTNNKPDILAPCHLPTDKEYLEYDQAVMRAGTSFATPFVAGQCANCLSVFKHEGADVTPEDIRRSLRKSGESIDGGRTLNVRKFFDHLGEPHGIEYSGTANSDHFSI